MKICPLMTKECFESQCVCYSEKRTEILLMPSVHLGGRASPGKALVYRKWCDHLDCPVCDESSKAVETFTEVSIVVGKEA